MHSKRSRDVRRVIAVAVVFEPPVPLGVFAQFGKLLLRKWMACCNIVKV
jgi:hypothetical protein